MNNYNDIIYGTLVVLNNKMRENDMVLSLTIVGGEKIAINNIESLSATTIETMSKIVEETEILIRDNVLSEKDNKIIANNNKGYNKTEDKMSFSNIEIELYEKYII